MSSIRVAVRVRPLNEKEKDKGSREIIEVDGKTITIENVKILGIPEYGDSRVKYKAFSYDHCYDCLDAENAYATQEQVFSDLGTQVLNSALDGYNACVFAYGQTGTGKTHTMMGYQGDPGLIPRICEGLFESIEKCPSDNVSFRVDISYFEIYNEKVRDLLQVELFNKQKDSQWLKVREHPKDGPYVQDLSWHRVREYTEIQTMLERGNENRVTAETHIHGHSSRSHAIVTVCFTQARLEENRPSEIVSKINLVDLAGSEKAGPSNIPDFRTRLKEGSNINRSLVTLGYIIKMLAEQSLLSWSTEDMGSTQSFSGSGGGESPAGSSPAGPNKQRTPFIPYRDSVLTRLLKDSLGGNSKTIMIATITPASQFYSETLSTLRYAQRAKNIINKPRVNEDSNVALIRELRREIERLRNMLASAQKGGEMLSLQEAEDTILAEKLQENEEMAKQLTRSWMGKWSSTHDVMKDSDLSIRNLQHRSSSMGVMIDSQLPYLVGMVDDVLSTGIVLFHLKEGETTVGREDAEVSQDIVLVGSNIQAEHCVIRHQNGVVMVHPLPGAECTVQGLECTEPTILSQGDFVVFGGDQVFRFNNPVEAAKLRENRKSMGSLNTLNTSYPSFGGLSRASSYSSIGADDSNFLSPYSQLGRSYPNRELEKKHQCEQERVAEVRNKLDQLQEEHERAEEVRLEKEEEMYALHEQHRQEVAEQKQQLKRLIEENERARQKADEELQQARESLAAEKEAFQKHLEAQRKQLKELQKAESSQTGIQTEPLATKSSSTDAINMTGVSIGTDSTDDITEDDATKDLLPLKRQRKISVEDQLKELEQNEFSRRMSYRETEESLSIQQEDVEDQYYQTQEKIREKMMKIEQIETEYKEMDKECLKQMSEQNKKVDELRKQEAQLEVYLQENEELRNVTQDVPRPLRSACSEISLQIPIEEYPQKTASLVDVHRQQDNHDTPEINIYSASAESLKSEQFNMDTDQGQGQSKRITDKDRMKKEKEKRKEKDITSVARDVTSRLYKPPEPKFKYVPKVREKEVTPVPRPPRVRDIDTRSRNSPSRFTPTHSPSPQRSVHSPSPLRKNSKTSSPSPQRDRQPSQHSSKSAQKKGGPNSTSSDKKPGKKDPKFMEVRNKSKANDTSSKSRALSPGSSHSDTASPDRLSPVGGRLASTKLRQMTSASSLASVPESVSEESEMSQEEPKPAPISYVVKRRAKKGRSGLFDDEFRTHSAPDSQNLEKAFNDYMISPGRQESERVLPVYNTSVSVDDSDMHGDYEAENLQDSHASGMDCSYSEINGTDQLAESTGTDSNVNRHGNVVLGKRDNQSLIDNLDAALISPRKRSKSEGADDFDFEDKLENENKSLDKTEGKTNRDDHFSDDSLNNSNVSEDSLDGKYFEPDRLTKSLPAYLSEDKKPISDDSLNDSLEEKRDLSEKDVTCDNDNITEKYDQKDRGEVTLPLEAKNIPEKANSNLSRVILSSIDIAGTTEQSSFNKESVDTGTLTDKQESPELFMDNTESKHTQSAYPKDQDIDRLKIVSLPHVSIESSVNCDKGIRRERCSELNNNDSDMVNIDKDIVETDDLQDNMNNNELGLKLDEDSNIDTEYSSQIENACDSETLDKVKQYIKDVVDEAKIKLNHQTKHDLESAIELSLDDNTVEMSSLSENELQSYDDVDGYMPIRDHNFETQGNETIIASRKKHRNTTDNTTDDNNSKLSEEDFHAKETKMNDKIDAYTSSENKSGSEEIESKLDKVSHDLYSNCVNKKFETDNIKTGTSQDIKTEGMDTGYSNPDHNNIVEAINIEKQTEVIIPEKKIDSSTDKGDNSSGDDEVLYKSIGVGTSLECLDMDLDNELGDTYDSCTDPNKEIQILQDALEQLPARPQSSGTQLSTARRAARHRRQQAMFRQQQRTAGDVDSAEPGSDDSPASGNRSKASSRPGSGSRRRKRPQNKVNEKNKPAIGHSSDDYDSSENDSVYSNGSIEDLIQKQDNGECENGQHNSSFNSALTDSSDLCDAEEMSRRLKGKYGSHPNKRKIGSTEVEEGPDGKRTVGIQTYGPPNGNIRNDISDFDSSAEMGRNMAVSPLCLWTTNKSEDGKQSSQNSSSSTGVCKSGSEPEKGMRPASSSSVRSVSSVFLENSNLGKGVTDVWSTSASDLRPLSDFDDDLSYVMETEAMTPGATYLDITENAPSGVSFIQPTGDSNLVRPGCSTPKNPGRIVSIMYPESQAEQAATIDYSKPVTFEVTVHEDNTNITYNVEKTEYKTYALKNEDQTRPQVIPDTIHVNITESQSSKTEEKFTNETKEEIKLCLPDVETDDKENGTVNSDRSVRSVYSSEKEINIMNGEIKSENVKELKQSLENAKQQVYSSRNVPLKKKKATLQTSGLVESTDYRGRLSDEDIPRFSPKEGLDNHLDESDITSDYGTFISFDERKGSDSEDDSKLDEISNLGSHLSRHVDIRDRNVQELNLADGSIDCVENTGQLETYQVQPQSEALCSNEDVQTPIHIASQTQRTSPVQFMFSSTIESSLKKMDSENLNCSEESNHKSKPSALEETASGSCSTVKTLNKDSEDKLFSDNEKQGSDNEKQDKSFSSVEEAYLSPEVDNNNSSCSSEYRTPQQSPREMQCNGPHMQVTNVIIPDMHESSSTASTPRVETTEEDSHGPVLTSSPKVTRTVSVNTDLAQLPLSISPETARVKHGFKNPCDPIHTEALRRELESKMANLQRNARSLSDSAISSDYTDCDSSSPRGNRICDNNKKARNKKCKSLFEPTRLDNNVSHRNPCRTLNFESEAVKHSSFKDSGNVLDDETDSTDKEEDYMKLPSTLLVNRNKLKEQSMFPIFSMKKFPETIIGAVLALKPFPVQRSASLDSISTLVKTGTSLSRAERHSQSFEDIPGGDEGLPKHEAIGDCSKIKNSDATENVERPLSPGEIGIGQGSIDDMVAAVENENITPDMDLPLNNIKTNLVPEKATSMSFLDDKMNGLDYQRSLSEGNIDNMEDIQDTSCTSNSNDSITFVFVGRDYNQEEDDNDCNQCKDDGENSADESPNDPYTTKINISGRGPLHSSCSDTGDGSVVLSRSASGESNHLVDDTEHNMSTHSASEEIHEVIQCINYSDKMQTPMELSSSPPTVTDFSENIYYSKGSEDEEESAPLRHRYGIDESVLPLPERSVSADNIPKQVVHLKDLNRSRSTSMLDMAAAEKEESESGIFPPALSYVDEDNTDPSMSLRTMSEGALEQISQRSFSDRGVTFSDQTSSELQSSEMESSSSANMRSICSNASSAEEIVEEYTINFTSNHPKYRSTKPGDECELDDEEAHMMEEEEHMREVLRTVEKFLLPRPHLADKETSTDPTDITVSEIIDDQSPKSEISTQTAVNAHTMIQPDQILLPALSAQYRSMSVDSFGLGRHGQDISLSEGAQNWCTLGELMVETTQLLRSINDRLPDMDKSESLCSEESQAILKQWQEISVQTGNSLQELNTVGLHTDEKQEKTLPFVPKSLSISCGTQVDFELKMKHLQPSEISTCEVIHFEIPENTSRELSLLTETASETEDTEEQIEEIIASTTASSNFTGNVTINETMKIRTFKSEEIIKSDVLNQTDKDGSLQHIAKGSHNESASMSSPRQALTLPNTPEMEDLRKEHNKLMGNLRKASEKRKARKDTIKLRKLVPTELKLTNEHELINDTVTKHKPENTSLSESSDTNISNKVVETYDLMPDTRSSVSSSLASPHEIIQIDIKTDANEGVTINNKTFKQKQKKEPVFEESNETETHSWKLLPTNAFRDMPDNCNECSRDGSTSSSTSVDTTISSEVAQVMKNASKTDVDERPGAVNRMFINNKNNKEGRNSSSIALTAEINFPTQNSETIKSNYTTCSTQADSAIENEVFSENYSNQQSNKSPFVDENDPRGRQQGSVPSFIKGETSPKLSQEKHRDKVESNKDLKGKEILENRYNDGTNKRSYLPKEELLSKLNDNIKSDNEISADEDVIVPKTSTKQLKMSPYPVNKDTLPSKQPQHIADDSSETEFVVEDLVEPVTNTRNQTLPIGMMETNRPCESSTRPMNLLSRKGAQSGQSDYGTQVSVEFSDDCTQTDPELQNELTEKSQPGQIKEQKITEDINNRLERLQEQNSHIMELLNMSSKSPSLTVEKLEAKLNHCIGQTDLLMNSYDEKDIEHTKRITRESTKTIDILTKYRDDLKKAKDDINECRERLNTGNEPGIGRGRTPFRRKDLQRLAQVEAFKLERFREQQDYERSRSNTPSKQNTPLIGNTPLRGNTPLIGNSPVVTPRSVDRSRSSSPTNSLSFLAPKEHKAHLIDLRKQLIADVVEEEKPNRTSSPFLSISPSPQRPKLRGESMGFSPKTSPERTLPLASGQGRSYVSPKRVPFNRYREPEEGDKSRSPTMPMPIEEMLRRSSFSSTGSQRSGSSRNEPFFSPRSHSDTRTPRKSNSPKQPDYSQPLSLNLDDLNDDDQPYSPYSAYARERVLPRERSPVGSGGVVRGTFELYSGSSQSDTSSLRSFGSDLDLSQGPVNPLDEDKVKHSRPVRADDIKSRLGRHKR